MVIDLSLLQYDKLCKKFCVFFCHKHSVASTTTINYLPNGLTTLAEFIYPEIAQKQFLGK